MAATRESLRAVTQEEFGASPLYREMVTQRMRSMYHSDQAHGDELTRDRRLLDRMMREFFNLDPQRSRGTWQWRTLRRLYEREEKTEFGARLRAFSGVVVQDKSQGRALRTDFTANMDVSAASAASSNKPGNAAAPHMHAATATAAASVGAAGNNLAYKRSVMAAKPSGSFTMRDKLAARRKQMMTWETFKEKNLGDLPGGTEEQMIAYRMKLDKAREARLSKGRNYQSSVAAKRARDDGTESTISAAGASKRRRKDKKDSKKKKRKKKDKKKKKSKSKKKKNSKSKKKKKKKKRHSDSDSDSQVSSDDTDSSSGDSASEAGAGGAFRLSSFFAPDEGDGKQSSF